jgi:diguanylate cyclase (GGDEF)-like protein/PAS domain S-box-containing protein
MTIAGLEVTLHNAALIPDQAGLIISALSLAALVYVLGRHRRELQRRRLASERYASLFENNTDAIVAIDASGGITGANPAFARLSGYSPDELLDVAFPSLVTPNDRRQVLEILGRASKVGSKTLETVLLHRESHEVPIELTTVPIAIDGQTLGAYHIIRDHTERKQLEEQLEARALHDHLTGLPNRSLFEDRMEHAIRRVRRNGGRVALLYMDLDGFKLVNDTTGHAAGDELLVEVAARLRCFLRDGDTVARLGGDEFAILLEDVTDEDASTSTAARVVELINQPFTLSENREVHIGASVGVAVSRADTQGPEELVSQADTAMYEAKRQGGHRLQLYSVDLELAQTEEDLHLEEDLLTAIEEDQLVLHYQPIVELAGTNIVGIEALVRWNHPIHGLIPPSSFLALAESGGLIVALDRWVLRRGCEDIQRMMDRGIVEPEKIFLSVNLSAHHFEDDGLIDSISEVLEGSEMAAGCLQLEITESAVGRGMDRIARLKNSGVRVAIDNFGTGDMSLGYLRDLNVDVLKIDRSFVSALGGDQASLAVVRTILTLAEMLDMEVVIEGIEEPVQLSRFQELGGRLVQGFYFGKPVALDELEKLLRRGLPPSWIYRPGSGVGLHPSDPKRHTSAGK